jgi:hypothetical protein
MKDDIIEETRLAPTIQKSIDETIPKKYSTIALGATTIGSAERAPDEKLSINFFELKYDDGLHYI